MRKPLAQPLDEQLTGHLRELERLARIARLVGMPARAALRINTSKGLSKAGGGSAGGHVAACTGTVPGFEGEEETVSSVPDCLVLFNPALDTTAPRIRRLIGEGARRLSPVHHVRRGAPPTILFHGNPEVSL